MCIEGPFCLLENESVPCFVIFNEKQAGAFFGLALLGSTVFRAQSFQHCVRQTMTTQTQKNITSLGTSGFSYWGMCQLGEMSKMVQYQENLVNVKPMIGFVIYCVLKIQKGGFLRLVFFLGLLLNDILINFLKLFYFSNFPQLYSYSVLGQTVLYIFSGLCKIGPAILHLWIFL